MELFNNFLILKLKTNQLFNYQTQINKNKITCHNYYHTLAFKNYNNKITHMIMLFILLILVIKTIKILMILAFKTIK